MGEIAILSVVQGRPETLERDTGRVSRGLLIVFIFLSSMLFVGCGGGAHSGGGTVNRGVGVLSVSLDGTAGSAEGPTGTTQTAVIFDSLGKEIQRKSVGLTAGIKEIDFTGLPAGTLHLHVGLSATSGGVEAGAVDTTFEGGVAARPVVVRMRQPVTSVLLSSALTLEVGGSTPVYPAAVAADGSYVSTAPGGWSWTSRAAGVATVDTTGLVTGVSEGSATVSATHLASGVGASITMSVLANVVTHGKWTIMVYMDAANDLFSFSPQNINQMESIAKNSDVRFVIQWKQVRGLDGNANPLFSGTRRYVANPDSSNEIQSTLVQDLGSGVDMASSTALRDFVTWTKTKYPADHYALVLWSHGGGWFSQRAQSLAPKKRAIIHDDETGNELNFPDVRSALDPGALDILAYDACLMQGAESLLEFADRTSVIVGSEDDVPGAGYPYQLVFKPFVDAPDTSTSVLASGMVSAYVNYYKDDLFDANWPIQLSALDTSKAPAVATALDGFAGALLDSGAAIAPAAQSVRTSSTLIQAKAGLGYFYYDLDQIAAGFAAQASSGTSIQSAATALNAAIQNAVIASAGGNGDRAALAYKGLSIDFSPSSAIDAATADGGYATGYNHLQLSTLTRWNEFLESKTANP